MKKLLGFLMMGAVMLSSCGNDHEDLYDPNAAALRKANEYAMAFVKQFGKIDPNHTWGFGDVLGSRGSNTESNMWYQKLSLPTRITSAEEEKVAAYFSTPSNYRESVQANWSDFFVQHVYKGTASYTVYDYSNGENTSGTVTGSDKMDQLSVGANESSMESVPNFNGGGKAIEQEIWTSNNQSDCYKEGLALMVNSSTALFGYQNSQDNSIIYYDYIIQEIDGAYYVGFDFSSNNNTASVKADGIYNDWIVKISPAEYLNAKRIIAEDLGTIGDFDFNDVVFDVAYNSVGIVVTLQAAGGTMPLYINGKEVHELFGVSGETMVNTGKGVNTQKVIFTLPGVWNMDDVEITVNNENVINVLEAPQGEAPQMICVDTNYQWTEERERIDTKYPKFKEYVNDNPNLNWY